MGQKGEINIDQAHRGYNMAADGVGYRSVNPLFMKYTPTDGHFSGQSGYGKFWRDVPYNTEAFYYLRPPAQCREAHPLKSLLSNVSFPKATAASRRLLML